MSNINKLDDEKFLEIAKSLGYDPKKSTDIEDYRIRISELDLWEKSKILFFGRTWEQY